MSNRTTTPHGKGFAYEDGDGWSLAAIKRGAGACISLSFDDGDASGSTTIDLPAAKVYEFAQWLLGQCGLSETTKESKARLDGIEEAAQLLDDTRREMRAPGNLADYGRGVLVDASAAIRRLKEIK